MRALRPDGMPVDAVSWATPWIYFWEEKMYSPSWLVYVEYAFMVAIVLVVLKFRPLRTQKPKPRFGVDGSKRSESEQDANAVANKYGRRRYADEWAKEAAKSARDNRTRDRLDR